MESIKYDPRVLIGNWQEELYLMKERKRIHEQKKEKGELKAQKACRFFDYMLKEVALSPPDECVRYGSVVQLLAPNVLGAPGGEGKNCGLVLSCLPTEAEVDSEQHLAEGCMISASPHLHACVRNAFIICSAEDPAKDGQSLLYGDSFVLRPAVTGDRKELCVHSKFGLLNNKFGKSGEPCLQLTSVKNVDTRWHCLFIDPKYRYETTGSPVLPNQKLIVCHSSSNRRLAVEHAFWNKTLFGPECEVSIHTITDAKRRESEKNIWIIATQKYGENKITRAPNIFLMKPRMVLHRCSLTLADNGFDSHPAIVFRLKVERSWKLPENFNRDNYPLSSSWRRIIRSDQSQHSTRRTSTM